MNHESSRQNPNGFQVMRLPQGFQGTRKHGKEYWQQGNKWKIKLGTREQKPCF